jgi:hypothetical protein
MIGKASRLSTAPRGRGKWHSVSPTSNASTNCRHLGGVNRWVGLTLSYLPQLSPSTAWEQPSTTSLSRQPMTSQSYSSLQRRTWRSLPPTPRSLRPTRSSRRLWLRSRHPRHALPVRQVYLGGPTNRFLGITVGLMAIVLASITRVQRAVTRQRGTRTRQRPPTRWEVAKPTRDGTRGQPEHSVASATLASVPSLPQASKTGHVMPAFPHTLIGLGPFANLGCKIVFTKTSVTVYHPDGHPILSGWRDETGPRLWHFPLTAEATQVVLDNASPQPPIPLTAEAAHVAVDEALHLPQLPIPPPPPQAPPADVLRNLRKQKWRRKLTRSCHVAGKQR